MNIRRLITLIIVTVVLSGCAAAPKVPELERDAVPASGRYTVATRDTGKITMMKVGTTIFSNAMQRVAISNSISEQLQTSIVESLQKRPAFDYVPSEIKLGFLPPEYLINSYDISFSTRNNEQTDAQETDLIGRLTELARDLDLDFVVVVNEWGSSDYIETSNQPLVGYGVYFRDLPFSVSRTIAVYTAYQIRLFDPNSRLFRSARGFGCEKLDKSRWLEIDWSEPPELGVVRSFLADIEQIVPPADLEETLFALGLLEIKPGASGGSLFSIERC